MAIFGREGNGTQESRASGQTGREPSLSIIAAGMTITGDVDTDGVVKVEGRVEGGIRAARQVLIGRQGEVRGDINTREAVIGGTVHGTINASERLEVQATSLIVGDINTRAIAVVEGGKINGAVRITDVTDNELGLANGLSARSSATTEPA